MNQKLTTSYHTLLTALTVLLLCSFTLPLQAGRMRSNPQTAGQSQTMHRDSGVSPMPTPIADDSPISPVTNDGRESQKRHHDRDQQKKKVRR